MFKKLFLMVFFAQFALAADVSAAVRPSVAANVTGRASITAVARSGTGLTPVSVGGGGGADARCANPLPDQITTSRCIQKYMACLKQDSVCGENFESCDTKSRFKQKRVFCHDKLLECPDEGISAIYGKAVTSTPETKSCDGETKVVARDFKTSLGDSISLSDLDFDYNSSSDEQGNQIAMALYQGAQYVALNSVTACRNAADGCIKRACQPNAFKCITGDSLGDNQYTEIAFLTGDKAAATATRVNPSMVQQYAKNMTYSGEQVRSYIKGACKTDVGTNKGCYIATNNGNMPPNDLWTTDDFEVEMVYNDVMTGSMSILSLNQPKIYEWLAKGVGTAIESCKTTASDCVKSSCGSGSLAACYGSALDNSGSIKIQQISEIAPRCTGIINANQNCRDLLVDVDDSADSIWERVWGSNGDGYVGAFGLVSQLNGELAQMFNETVVKNTRKQCQVEAEACIRRECGTNFGNCYINDKWLSHYNSSGTTSMADGIATAGIAGGFDEGMARDLCLIPVKRSDTCQNYFDIQYAKNAKDGTGDSWGTNASVRASWGKAAAAATCTVTKTYQKQMRACDMDEYGQDTNCRDYEMEATKQEDAVCARQEASIFNDLIADIGATARAQLTKEQNTLKNKCESHRGQTSFGDTYVWTTKPETIPDTYSIMGLQAHRGQPTTDLWGAFCQVKVTLSSQDRIISKMLQGGGDVEGVNLPTIANQSAFFSLGDTVMCGSWLKQTDLDEIEKALRSIANKQAEKERTWASQNAGLIAGLVGAVAGGVGGGFAGNAIGKKIDEKTNARNDKYSEISDEAFAIAIRRAEECKTLAERNLGFLEKGKDSWKIKGEEENVDNKCVFSGISQIDGANRTIIVYELVASLLPLSSSSPAEEDCGDMNFGTTSVSCVKSGGAIAKLDAAIKKLEEARNVKATGEKTEKGAHIGMGVGAGVGALALGLGAGFMTKSIADKNFELEQLKKADEAVKAWFDTVGSKIKCTVGGDTREVGSYGDMIELK